MTDAEDFFLAVIFATVGLFGAIYLYSVLSPRIQKPLNQQPGQRAIAA
jgi:hypothetical protein